jgi:hypothetical protein
MTKQFIPYEEAVELEELGFNDPCHGCWVSEKIFEFGINFRSVAKKRGIEAPLYQQAFRFFREKYGYTVIVLHSEFQILKELSTSTMLCMETGKQIPIYVRSIYHQKSTENYEQAELDCLKKLIQLAKK